MNHGDDAQSAHAIAWTAACFGQECVVLTSLRESSATIGSVSAAGMTAEEMRTIDAENRPEDNTFWRIREFKIWLFGTVIS